MRFSSLSLSLFLSLLILVFPSFPHAKPSQKPPGKGAILLSNVHTLTLRGGRYTTGRRLSPIPQLTCTGPSKRICNLYKIETMRCVNDGYDYDEEDIQWTCTASLPPEFKLGSTDVICEGYWNADDKWVLKGSCGVEYRLLLTELGDERFGGIGGSLWNTSNATGWSRWLGNLLFFGFIAAPIILIFLPLVLSCLGLRRNGRGPNPRRGWSGFWGGGGGGGGRGDDYGPYPGPPPPYSSYPSSSWFGSASPWQGWRPGFWTGALGGASLGYEFARRRGNTSPFMDRYRTPRRFNDYYDPGEGSSRSSRPAFSSTTSSTGFGSTRRR